MSKEVSIILVIRNEEDHIKKCLDSLINQNFPKENYEIIIVDGMSDDQTLNIVSQYQSKHPNLISITDNPKKIKPVGLNIGKRIAKGKILQVFDGHSTADKNFLTAIVKQFNNSSSDVAAIGGSHVSSSEEKFFGKVVGDVQNSFLGGFKTSYRIKNNTSVESLPFTAYKKDVLEKIDAKFDERFVVAQDLEINLRIKQAGYKLQFCPDAKFFYFRRHNSLKLLAKRMFNYGFWRMQVTKKHPKSFRAHLFFPIILIISMGALPFFVYLNFLFAQLIIAGLIAYSLAVVVSSMIISLKRRNIKYMIAVVIYLTEHFCYGLGTIIGLFKKLPSSIR